MQFLKIIVILMHYSDTLLVLHFKPIEFCHIHSVLHSSIHNSMKIMHRNINGNTKYIQIISFYSNIFKRFLYSKLIVGIWEGAGDSACVVHLSSVLGKRNQFIPSMPHRYTFSKSPLEKCKSFIGHRCKAYVLVEPGRHIQR